MNIVKVHVKCTFTVVSYLVCKCERSSRHFQQVKGAIIRSLFLKLPRNSVDTFIEDTYVSQQERM